MDKLEVFDKNGKSLNISDVINIFIKEMESKHYVSKNSEHISITLDSSEKGIAIHKYSSLSDVPELVDVFNDSKSHTTDLKPIVFKKGDYLTYIGGSATKYLVIGEKYRTTWDAMNRYGRVAIIGINKKRLVMPLRFFTN